MKPSSAFQSRLIHKATDLRLVRQIPAEINLYFDDLRSAHRDDLGVAKPVAARTTRLIGHEHPLAVGHKMDELKPFGGFAVGPAAFEIGRAVDAVVQWAAEVKIFGNQRLYRRTVLFFIGLVGCVRNRKSGASISLALARICG